MECACQKYPCLPTSSLVPVQEMAMIEADNRSWEQLVKLSASSHWLLILVVVSAFLTSLKCVEGAREADRISRLPGQPEVPFAQFAGYVPVDQNKQRVFFYYFVEAWRDNPSDYPFVLWLNGGPGCSSVGGGGFGEIGPFWPNGYGTGLRINSHAWTKEANILFVESPAGVGFSYSNDSSDYKYYDDKLVAHDNLQFLLNWLDDFPEYKTRDFYITGESYAGHYIPDLTYLIIQHNQVPGNYKFNLKGVAIGNPFLSLEYDQASIYDYRYTHGFSSESTYRGILDNCVFADYDYTDPDYNQTQGCVHFLRLSDSEVGDFINPYDVIVDVCFPAQALQEIRLRENISHKSIGNDVCLDTEEEYYLNQPSVQMALHVYDHHIYWTDCSDLVTFPAYNPADLKRDLVPVLGEIVKSGILLLIFSGDQDDVVPLSGTRIQIDGLATTLGLNVTLPYSSWFHNNQVGGWQIVYGNQQLSFATVRGAAHMVPYSQPARALGLFRAFLRREPLNNVPPPSPVASSPAGSPRSLPSSPTPGQFPYPPVASPSL